MVDSAKAVALASRADATLDPTLELVYWEALMLTIAGDRTAAFERLTVYLAASPQQSKHLDKDQTWWTRDLRSDPRWQALAVTTR